MVWTTRERKWANLRWWCTNVPWLTLKNCCIRCIAPKRPVKRWNHVSSKWKKSTKKSRRNRPKPKIRSKNFNPNWNRAIANSMMPKRIYPAPMWVWFCDIIIVSWTDYRFVFAEKMFGVPFGTGQHSWQSCSDFRERKGWTQLVQVRFCIIRVERQQTNSIQFSFAIIAAVIERSANIAIAKRENAVIPSKLRKKKMWQKLMWNLRKHNERCPVYSDDSWNTIKWMNWIWNLKIKNETIKVVHNAALREIISSLFLRQRGSVFYALTLLQFLIHFHNIILLRFDHMPHGHRHILSFTFQWTDIFRFLRYFWSVRRHLDNALRICTRILLQHGMQQ